MRNKKSPVKQDSDQTGCTSDILQEKSESSATSHNGQEIPPQPFRLLRRTVSGAPRQIQKYDGVSMNLMSKKIRKNSYAQKEGRGVNFINQSR